MVEDFKRADLLDLSKNVSTSATEKEPESKETEVQFDGVVGPVFVGFPLGSNNAAGIRLEVAGEAIIPRNKEDTYITAPEAPLTPIPVRFRVSQGDILTSKFVNNTASDKFLNVMPILTEE